MRRRLLPIPALLWGLIPIGAATAQGPVPTKKPLPELEQAVVAEDSLEAQVSKAIEAYNESYSAWTKKMREAEADKRREVFSQRPTPIKTLEILKPLVKDQAGTKAHWQVVAWALEKMAPDEAIKEFRTSLLEHYSDREEVGNTAWRMRGPEAKSYLQALAAKSKNHSVLAKAKFGLMEKLVEEMDADGADLASLEREITKLAKELDSPDLGSVLLSSDVTVQSRAQATLFVVQNLSIGKVVPEIRSEDIDGTTFALSDYRGKVVMLDFWGDW